MVVTGAGACVCTRSIRLSLGVCSLLDLEKCHAKLMERLVEGFLVCGVEMVAGLVVEQCEEINEVTRERKVNGRLLLSRSGNDSQTHQCGRRAHRDKFAERGVGPLTGPI